MSDPARILVVCTANICRSPLAELLLAEYLSRHAPEARVVLTSAGTHARQGDAAASGMRRVVQEWGLDLSYHRSRRVDAALVAQQDLVVTMEDVHRTTVSRLGTGIAERTFTLPELAALMEQVEAPPRGDLAAHVAAWHRGRVRVVLDVADVDDPYGGPDDGYTDTAWELAALVERVGPRLAAVLNGS